MHGGRHYLSASAAAFEFITLVVAPGGELTGTTSCKAGEKGEEAGEMQLAGCEVERLRRILGFATVNLNTDERRHFNLPAAQSLSSESWQRWTGEPMQQRLYELSQL